MEKQDYVAVQKFSNINLTDEFFDSLKLNYDGFEEWFSIKAVQDEEAYVMYRDDAIAGFMYLKDETEEIELENQTLRSLRRLKIGTFKLDSRGTILGERFLAIALRYATEHNFERAYVTVFEEHKGIVKLFEKFGFECAGKKLNQELFLGKRFEHIQKDPYKDFPKISVTQPTYSLAIEAKFHTKLFPDSILQTEKDHNIEDLALTNTLSKTYLTKMKGTKNLKAGDLLFIYRKTDSGSGSYHSVITSVCTVLDVQNIENFTSLESYLKYIGKGTIFSESELKKFYEKRSYKTIIKMIYDFPMKKKVILKDFSKIVEKPIIGTYWGFVEFSKDQAKRLLEKGRINESFIIN